MDGCDIVVGAKAVMEVVAVLTVIAKALVTIAVLQAMDLFIFRAFLGR